MQDSQAIELMSALAQETRFRVYTLLLEAGEQGIAAGEIADSLKVPATTLSAHLSILSKARVVESRRESRKIIYYANVEAVRGLTDFLSTNCCGRTANMTDFSTQAAAE